MILLYIYPIYIQYVKYHFMSDVYIDSHFFEKNYLFSSGIYAKKCTEFQERIQHYLNKNIFFILIL